MLYEVALATYEALRCEILMYLIVFQVFNG
ncbi:hypothetical protein F383_04230 [Gossypium arboreum]|uniref:Uncharacterized protein n=1 Tax=Gossypium arboreum TaxID=29729 RepID=A0A0B0PQJ3_GOSAR|nr:hypothetical protein F383_04230 [Gossypium arboreum]